MASLNKLKTFSGAKIAQRTDELMFFIDLLKKNKVKKFLEIGSRHGDTLHAIGMMAIPKGGMLRAVEMPEGPWGQKESHINLQAAVDDLISHDRDVEIILGDSKLPKTISAAKKEAPYDAILIDGDHTLVGATLDWVNYHKMAKIVAFHDIAPDERAVRKGVRVRELWKELKSQYRNVEIHGAKRGMGIGVLFLED